MSKTKKNVFQEFMQDDYVPEGNQFIVKYVAGRGNNLHEVEDIDENHYLVSMPKKFRQTVWLKKNDCIVIDPITEGKKVRGEIVCVIPVKDVVQLLEKGLWRPKSENNFDKDTCVRFFQKHLDMKPEESATSLVSSDDDTDTSDSGSNNDDDDAESDEHESDNSFEENSESINMKSGKIEGPGSTATKSCSETR